MIIANFFHKTGFGCKLVDRCLEANEIQAAAHFPEPRILVHQRLGTAEINKINTRADNKDMPDTFLFSDLLEIKGSDSLICFPICLGPPVPAMPR